MTSGGRTTGGTWTLPLRARAVFVTARAMAHDDGIVADRRILGPVLGLSPSKVREWLAYLETRTWQHRALAKRRGPYELWVLLIDGIPGVPRRGRPEAGVDDVDRTGRPMGTRDWRQLRAQVGGLKRAMTEAIERRRQADAEVDRLRGAMRADTSEDLAALRADLAHIVSCGAAARGASCTHCEQIRSRVGAERPRWVEAGHHDDDMPVRLAALEVLASMRDRGLGAAKRRVQAHAALARALEECRT